MWVLIREVLPRKYAERIDIVSVLNHCEIGTEKIPKLLVTFRKLYLPSGECLI